MISLIDTVRDPASKTISLIFEYVNNTDYRILYPSFSEQDLKFYIFEILKTLDYSHSMGIIHRDIKPHNIMIDPEKK